jgi:hypothetical protein
MKVWIILFAAFFYWILSSCSRVKPFNIDVNGQLKSHFFKKGTYWIYRDSISGQIDSFYVTSTYDAKSILPVPLNLLNQFKFYFRI